LDSINENIIVSRLKELSYKRTVIIIAHRLSSIRRADVIFVLKQGCIVEEGTHEELLEKDCSYAKLLNNQLSS
jgi:ABC-type multidrug transport system fused ATPase/permease subunit